MQKEAPFHIPAQPINHRWSLVCAAAIGVSGLAGYVVTVLVLAASNQTLYPWQHLSYYETHALNIIIECVATICAGYIALVACRRSGRGFWSSIQWRDSYTRIGLFGAAGVALSLIMRYVITRQVVLRMSKGNAILMTLIFLGTVVLQPFIEETYFRGILFVSLAEKIGSLGSICAVTVLFVLCHPQHYWIVLPVSIVLGILRVYTQSTANCYALHAGYNLGVILWGLH